MSRRNRRRKEPSREPYRQVRPTSPPPGPARRNFVVVGHRALTSPRFTLTDLPGSAGRLDLLCRCVNSALFLSNGLRRDSQLWMVLQGPPGPPVTIRFDGRNARYLNPDERSTGALVRHALIKLEEEEQRALKLTSRPKNNGMAAGNSRLTDGEDGTEMPDDDDSEVLTKQDAKVKSEVGSEEKSDEKSEARPDVEPDTGTEMETDADEGYPEVGELERTPGVYVSRTGLTETLARLASAGAEMVLLEEDARAMDQVLESISPSASLPLQNGTDVAEGETEQIPVGPRWAFVLGDDRDLTEAERTLVQEHHAVTAGLGSRSLLTSHCIVLVQALLDELELKGEQV